MQDSSGEIYTYYILNENEEVVSQGILDFSSTDNYTIDLWSFLRGAYALVIVHGGHTFCGTFGLPTIAITCFAIYFRFLS